MLLRELKATRPCWVRQPELAVWLWQSCSVEVCECKSVEEWVAKIKSRTRNKHKKHQRWISKENTKDKDIFPVYMASFPNMTNLKTPETENMKTYFSEIFPNAPFHDSISHILNLKQQWISTLLQMLRISQYKWPWHFVGIDVCKQSPWKLLGSQIYNQDSFTKIAVWKNTQNKMHSVGNLTLEKRWGGESTIKTLKNFWKTLKKKLWKHSKQNAQRWKLDPREKVRRGVNEQLNASRVSEGDPRWVNAVMATQAKVFVFCSKVNIYPISMVHF